jgi:hypothetical protein
MQGHGITTVIVVSHSRYLPGTMRSASNASYQPEWFVLGGGNDYQLTELNWQQSPPDQVSHLFALSGTNKGAPPADRPSRWALDEAGYRPTEDVAYERLDAAAMEADYHRVLVLASGIQAAGPNLTPETFGRGLQQLTFPNPGAGAEPYYQGSLGYAGDFGGIDDEAILWWSPTAPAYSVRSADTGGWCYVEKGRRWRRGQWVDRESALFDQRAPCR